MLINFSYTQLFGSRSDFLLYQHIQKEEEEKKKKKTYKFVQNTYSISIMSVSTLNTLNLNDMPHLYSIGSSQGEEQTA